ncbi:aspartate aminotransferase [Heterostelium album PN500]|uniref:Aspartate aminotransferase n=1 Tax=Heterostelium pallidum (strain ATCC 26659 / Pp 5 / PN500) TaxID=670386 RepID=D3AVJ4_HETP5|nr:aspartate aminotransferase [Heterostelium album PN500]EFA86317.1 aspartate aminotransferase [Heterostelium album PN500]|eukprot:XP_020438422.1 aspartate aminotransferase [Heterostelium album PN500]
MSSSSSSTSIEKVTSRIQNSLFVPLDMEPNKTAAQVDTTTSLFTNVPLAPVDPIIGVSQAYKADPSPNKVDVSVGAYRDEQAKPYVLKCVRAAEERLLGATKEYLPIDGIPEFNLASAQLLYGKAMNGQEKRMVTVQTLSGTGAVRLGVIFIRKYLPAGTTVYASRPTWVNHHNICKESGVPSAEYTYYDNKNNCLNFEGMIADMRAAPNGSVFILHLCAHNPTGCDPSKEQWGIIADVMAEKKHIPFVDCAYQGYASGDLDNDAYSARLFFERGFEMFSAQSYSKNFGLYGERAGALTIVSHSEAAIPKMLSQLKMDIRAMYSSPPTHGARLVATVLGDPALRALWIDELKQMSGRILRVRKELYDALVARNVPGDWSHIVKQIGMFTYTGLSPAQVEYIVKKYHIYLLASGRVSIAGLNSKSVPYFADAIADAVKVHPK